MTTLIICITGVFSLLLLSFVFSFYREMKDEARRRLRRMKKRKEPGQQFRESSRKEKLKIPGYYEESMNRSRDKDWNINSRPTII